MGIVINLWPDSALRDLRKPGETAYRIPEGGLFRWVSCPNYLGEMLIYASFALMVWHWLPVLVLAWVWCGLFAVNMMMKEASLSRYSGWQEYKKNSKWLLPGIF